MHSYVIRRLLLAVPTVLIASLIIFLMIRLIPGDMVDIMVAEVSGGAGSFRAEDIDRAAIEKRLGLDVPVMIQYGRWLGILRQDDGNRHGLLQGNLGVSMWNQVPVTDSMANRWPITLELGLMALVFSLIIALPIGLYSALRQDTLGDYLGRSIAILLVAVPGFWVATLVVVMPSIWWNWSRPLVYVTFVEDPVENIKMLIVPALVLAMAMAGDIMRMVRTMMLEVLRQDYIRTAWSKGLRERVVVVRHALKNAIIPVITLVGYRLPILIGGTVIIETIFSLPGMGRLIIRATQQRDYTLLSGLMFVFAVAMVLINLLVDLLYAKLDPRIRYE
jgi:peptide/nickel transport system permease protein